MRHTPQFRANRLSWRFNKSGGGGVRCKEFDKHPEDVRDTVRDLVKADQDEELVLLHWRTDSDWLLVTDRRVLWQSDNGLGCLTFDKLIDATVSGNSLRAAGGKHGLQKLTLIDAVGQKVDVAVESGPPFAGVWNSLKMAATWGSEGHSSG